MKLQKSQKRLLLVLGLVLIYALIDFISNSDRYKKYYFTEDDDSKATVILRNAILTPAKKQTFVDQDLSWKRDPFTQRRQSKTVKIIKRVNTDSKLNLKAITFDSENSFVMINDKILMEGEIIQGYLIRKIYKDKVELFKNGITRIINLNSK